MTEISLRDYQQEALDAVLYEFSQGISRQLIVLPTGAGKTIVMAAIAKQFNRRTLVIAHREELITQAIEKFRLFWPEVNIGICKAEKDEVDCQVVVGSIQTCCRPHRLEKLKAQGFDVLFIDECHHASADSYQTLIRELGFKHDSQKLLIGVTATPNRWDGKGLDETFQKITYTRSVSTMIRAGYLAPVIGRKILTNLTLDRVRITNGDFDLNHLAEVVNSPERNDFIAEKYKVHAKDRKGVAFCVDVQHCKDMAEALQKHDIPSKPVWGDMPAEDRKAVISDLKEGRIQVATSCGVLTEGFDEPSISVIAMARPTKSHSLYIQCVGRGLRLHPGKEDCLCLDFTDKGHNLDAVLSLSSVIKEATIINDKEDVTQKEEIDCTRKQTILDECDEEFDVLGSAKFIWIDVGDSEWSLIDDNGHEIILTPSGNDYIATLYQKTGITHQIAKSPLPLPYAQGVAEDFARKHLKIAFADASAKWMGVPSPVTVSQRHILEPKGLYKEDMTRSQAAMSIRQIISLNNKKRRMMASEPPTLKQLYALKSMGINTVGMNKHDAWIMLSKLKGSQMASSK